MIEIVSSNFSDHKCVKLEINDTKKTKQPTNIWRNTGSREYIKIIPTIHSQRTIKETRKGRILYLSATISGA